MSDFIFSVNVTFPIFLVMVIGWVLHQIGMLDEHFVTVANRFNFKVTLPFMLFRDIASVEISKVFDVAVINNQTKPVLIKKRKAEGVNIPTTRLSIVPIVLENHVPQKVQLTYDFGNSYNIVLKQGVMPAMNVLLSKNLLYEKFPISELKNIKTPLKKLSGIVNLNKELSKSEMSKKEIVTKLEQEVLPKLQALQKIEVIAETVRTVEDGNNGLNVYLKAMQLLLLFNQNTEAFKAN